MAGNNDRIYGFTQIYQNQNQNGQDIQNIQNVPARFRSFNLGPGNRPLQFLFRPVVINGGGLPAQDHQGHIVPQNILNMVLDPLMVAMAQAADLQGIHAFIQANAAVHPWLQPVFNYGTAIGAPMFDFGENVPEDKVGGFFSIVTWNPVNICRAPTDDRRNNLPGQTIDAAVRNYLNGHQAAQGVNAGWWQALAALVNALTPPVIHPNNQLAAINDYITACSATLAGQQNAGIGYYTFGWVNNNNILSPQA